MPNATNVPVAGRLAREEPEAIHRTAKKAGKTISMVLDQLVRHALLAQK